VIWVGKNLAEQGVICCIYNARDVGMYLPLSCHALFMNNKLQLIITTYSKTQKIRKNAVVSWHTSMISAEH